MVVSSSRRGVECPQNHESLSAEIGTLEPVRVRVRPCIHVGWGSLGEEGGGHNGEWGEAVNSNTSENVSPFYSSGRAGNECERAQKRRTRARDFAPFQFQNDTLFRDSCCCCFCCWRMGNGSYLQKGVEEEEEEEEEQVYLSFARAQADTHSRRYRGGRGAITL